MIDVVFFLSVELIGFADVKNSVHDPDFCYRFLCVSIEFFMILLASLRSQIALANSYCSNFLFLIDFI